MKIFLDGDYFFNFVKQNKMTIIKVSAGVLLLVLAFFVFCMKHDEKADFELSSGTAGEVRENAAAGQNATKSDKFEFAEEEDETKEVYVDVSGAVVKPNVYKLKSGARVYEAIKMAGGFTDDANAQNLNLAAKLNDQDKIVVLTNEELEKQNAGLNESFVNAVSGGQAGSESKSGSRTLGVSRDFESGAININSATQEQLETIKGIGPAMAARILEYRSSNGGFSSIEDLKNVKGIGEKMFAKLKDSVRV